MGLVVLLGPHPLGAQCVPVVGTTDGEGIDLAATLDEFAEKAGCDIGGGPAGGGGVFAGLDGAVGCQGRAQPLYRG